MKETARDPLPWLLGVAAGLFYLSQHSSFYNFDGVACAIAVELSDFAHLTHGNHLAYGLAGWLFNRLWQALGYAGGALLPLQALDSLLGAAGVGVFASLLLRLGASRATAALAACGLALSQAYWLWSLEAQVYLLGAFFLLLAAREAFGPKPRPVPLGLWCGLAVLGHVGHVLFAPAAAYLLWASTRSRRAVLRYLVCLALTAGSAYAATAVWLAASLGHAWRVWLLGSASLSPDRSFIWYGGYSPRHLADWASMTLRLFVDPFAAGGGGRSLLGWLLSSSAMAACAAGLWKTPPPRRRAALAAGLWLACYACLFVSWQPYTVVYRITDLIPLWLLAVVGLERLPRARRTWPLAVWVLAAGLYNWSTVIAPAADPTLNGEYQEALWVGAATPPDAWVVATARGQVYIPYFAHRRTLNLRYFEGRPGSLDGRLDQIAADGGSVYVTAATLAASGEGDFFRGYGLDEVAAGPAGTLFKARKKGSPAAAGRRN